MTKETITINGRTYKAKEFVFDFDTLDIIDNYLYFISDSDYDRIYRLNMDTLETECIEYDDISYVG